MKREIVIGCLCSIVALFPAAFVLTLVYQFPVPMFGQASGFEAALRSPVAVLFYGVLIGLFPIAGLLGVAGGWTASRIAKADERWRMKLAAVLGSTAGVLVAVALALWDRIYGPW